MMIVIHAVLFLCCPLILMNMVMFLSGQFSDLPRSGCLEVLVDEGDEHVVVAEVFLSFLKLVFVVEVFEVLDVVAGCCLGVRFCLGVFELMAQVVGRVVVGELLKLFECGLVVVFVCLSLLSGVD